MNNPEIFNNGPDFELWVHPDCNRNDLHSVRVCSKNSEVATALTLDQLMELSEALIATIEKIKDET